MPSEEARRREAIKFLQGLQERQELAKHTLENDLLRGVVDAREFGGLTFQDIADALGRSSAGAIHHLYTRAKERGF